jgi:glutathione S-transferase
MGLTIHGISASRAIRPLWAAQELGIPFEQDAKSYKDGGTRTPEFLALNPNGHIPVLVDARPEGEVVVWESMACVLYLARLHGRGDGTDLAPCGAREEAEALRWAFWTVTELESDALTVLMHRMAMPADRRKPELADAAAHRLKVPLRVLESHLQAQADRAQPWLAADRFTVADLCVASVANWARPEAGLLEAFPLTRDWLHRCIERPAYLAAKAMP